jgi:hypothetical protein
MNAPQGGRGEYVVAIARGSTAEIAGTAESLKYLSDLLENLRLGMVSLNHEHPIAPSWGGADLADVSHVPKRAASDWPS